MGSVQMMSAVMRRGRLAARLAALRADPDAATHGMRFWRVQVLP